MSTDLDPTPQPARYVVGIDLGTTNSALAFVDTTAAGRAEGQLPRVQTFAIPQLVAPSVIENRETLPSFHYQRAAGEFVAAALRMPWDAADPEIAVGLFARDHGGAVPGRMISSAKSWLCHSGVDRLAELLPWHGAADVERLSPVEASARYLGHLRAAWNHRFAKYPLEQQDVVLTLPASFDEVARELTVRAAARAGLPRVILIEEPQAAFYAWIDAHGQDWEQRVSAGQKILVCDIGGGTSDFTLIRVRQGAGGKVQFQRVAVGEHLILGGDNLDLALAHQLERKLVGEGKLEPRAWSVLLRGCRQAKETLLGENPPERVTLNLPGGGSRLIGGGRQVEATRDEVEQCLVEGFLPRVPLDARPAARRSGFQEFGLPYAADPAMTKYLAAFLSAHRGVALEDASGNAGGDHDSARPDLVLFNGGLFASPVLRRRLLDVLGDWFSPAGGPRWSPVVLHNPRLDLAVAWGAAYYGLVRRGLGVRISAGLARTYYLGIAADGAEPARGLLKKGDRLGASGDAATESADRDVPVPFFQQATCLVPAGVEEGQSVDLGQRRFDLLIHQPVEFPLLVSSTRLTDKPGDLVAIDPEQMIELPPIRTVLQSSSKKKHKGEADRVTVTLHARLTEIGTLELWCAEAPGPIPAGRHPRTWRLQFDVRPATQTDRTGHGGAAEQLGIVDEPLADACRALIQQTFGPGGPLKKGDRHVADTSSGSSSSIGSEPVPFFQPTIKPEGLIKRLAEQIGSARDEWPPSLLRALWQTLMDVEAGRKLSPSHEARWLNLLGFALRPGYGMAVDDWRVAQTWRTMQGKLVSANPMCRAERWILWRRIAGGLTAGQQRALAEPLVAEFRDRQRALAKGRGGEFRPGAHEAAEVWRFLGSLELLAPAAKIELGNLLLDLGGREKTASVEAAAIWALGRLAARVPMYGPLNGVVPVDVVEPWLERLLAMRGEIESAPFAAMQAARKTDDRYRDIAEPLRQQVAEWLQAHNAPEHYAQLVLVGGQLQAEEQGLMFGESLPQGLRLSAT